MTHFILAGATYRIRRSDKLNMCIERHRGKMWLLYGYYGNSHAALSRGLGELVAAHHSPDEAQPLADQVAALRADLATGLKVIEVALANSRNER